MASVPPRIERRRARPGSLERPVNGRLYRGTWLLVGLPLLVAAFSVARPAPLPRSSFIPAFNGDAAKALASELVRQIPDRSPGSARAPAAADWFRGQLEPYGLPVRSESFSAEIPGRGRVRLQNLSAEAVGRSPGTIVVMAHGDNDGRGPGGSWKRVDLDDVVAADRRVAVAFNRMHEAKAARLPAIMTVPLILFILPTLFVVILGPASCSINDSFLHG